MAWQVFLAAHFAGSSDMAPFSSIGKPTKVDPTKVRHDAVFSTTSATFVDVTGMSITVPDGHYYVLKVNYASASGTVTIQLLEGASVKFTTNKVGTGGSVYTLADTFILQNKTGAPQTVKLQIKVTGGFTANTKDGVILEGVSMLQFNTDNKAVQNIAAYLNEISFLCTDGNVFYDEVITNYLEVVTPADLAGLTKFVNEIKFDGENDVTNVGYIAFDWIGIYLILT